MRKDVICVSMIVLPIVSAVVTYTFISLGTDAIALDDTQSLILLLALIKMIILGSSGVFPVRINDVVGAFMNRGTRNEVTLYQLPAVNKFPCTRRLLCEVEMSARSSDNYLPKEPAEVNGRNPEEEVSPIQEDPITEMHIETVKALYREDDNPGELTAPTRRALELMENLTGKRCEEAYRRCPGRYTAPLFIRAVFDEFHFKAEDDN